MLEETYDDLQLAWQNENKICPFHQYFLFLFLFRATIPKARCRWAPYSVFTLSVLWRFVTIGQHYSSSYRKVSSYTEKTQTQVTQTNRQATSLRLDAEWTNVLQIADTVFNIMIHTPFSSQHFSQSFLGEFAFMAQWWIFLLSVAFVP